MPCSTTWLTSTSMGTVLRNALEPFLSLNEKARSKRSLPRAFSCSDQGLQPSIQEGHVPHGPGLALGVHPDSVPAVQHDRGMVGVTNAALDGAARGAAHGAPAPALRLRAAGQDALVLRLV